ncbi:MAG: hypothetical protein SNI70_11865 [Rikenellaceae bacterium]
MRSYYRNNIKEFTTESFDSIWAQLTAVGRGDLLHTQKQAWLEQIDILKEQLAYVDGDIFFEYSIPRLGKRVDVVVAQGVVFVIEFKIGANEFATADINQVWDYALDLKYFHEQSHSLPIVPILVSTNAKDSDISIFQYDDPVVTPILEYLTLPAQKVGTEKNLTFINYGSKALRQAVQGTSSQIKLST